ncbi:MAG TPA: CPCC family cysteine-rich protein, partial [Burkholderiaceae bacterium]|nr:CPCC family cysteine-rich protein [Burkholderiaceae bacterium]
MPRKLHQCPCCDYFTLNRRGEYDICRICFWEDSGQDVDRPDDHSGPNHQT